MTQNDLEPVFCKLGYIDPVQGTVWLTLMVEGEEQYIDLQEAVRDGLSMGFVAKNFTLPKQPVNTMREDTPMIPCLGLVRVNPKSRK